MNDSLFEDEADFVIVGTGAGGATAGRVLSEAGFEVVFVEEGPLLPPRTSESPLLETMSEAVRGFGTLTTVGIPPIPILQGSCVGGSTAINSGIIWRLPDEVRRDWIYHWGLDELLREIPLYDAFETIEQELGIELTRKEILGGNAERMDVGAKALGLPGWPTRRNARDCQGSARCLQGCPSFARQSMDVSYIPFAQQRRARVYALFRVDRIWIEQGKAKGVEGTTLNSATRRPLLEFKIRARRAVIIAASAIQTPVILRRSGIKYNVGNGFQSHPGAAVVGRFDDPITMGVGATQGYEIPLRERGYKLESLSLPPEMIATRLPGAGIPWQEKLQHMGYMAQWCVQVRMKALGTVRSDWQGHPLVFYRPLAEDYARLQQALFTLAKMMFAAGAKEVYLGLGGLPEIVRSVDELQALENVVLPANSYHVIASHLFGTTKAGTDPKRTVVDAHLKVRACDKLYVMDASVFPTNLGVNPQHSIMALAWRAADLLANRSYTV